MPDSHPPQYHDEVEVPPVPGPEDPTPADVPRGESEVSDDDAGSGGEPC